MRSAWHQVVCGLLLCLSFGVGAAQTPRDFEQELLSAFGMEGYSIVYLDEQNRALTSEEAFSHLAAGHVQLMKGEQDDEKKVLQMIFKKEEEKPRRNTEQPLPRLKGLDHSGRAITRVFDPQRYTLLSFYFSECLPCVAEVPMLNRFAKRHPEIELIGITFDDHITTQAFVTERGVEIEIISEAADFIQQAQVQTFPTFILLNPEGNIVGQKSGGNPKPALEEQLQALEAWIESKI